MSEIEDELAPAEVVSSTIAFEGLIWNVKRDEVALSDESVTREYLAHPGAVGIIALDDDDRVLLVRQYRHPVRSMLWEAPAGLLDVEGEHPLRTAQRELLEEAHYTAGTWHVLYDTYLSPGGSTESMRCFLARDLAPATGERFIGHGEERDMEQRWLPLDELVARALGGKIHSPVTLTGALAAHIARESGWATLRAPDSPWPERFPVGLPPLPPEAVSEPAPPR